MQLHNNWEQDILNECAYKTSRSSGPGGQHVNKTESRVELRWNLSESKYFTEVEKIRIRQNLKSRLAETETLILTSDIHRSQKQNKDEVEKRFIGIITKALIIPKKRKKSKPTKSSIEKRIKLKKMRSEIKKSRKFKY